MKKLFALLLAMMMIFTLAACGENNTTDPDKDNPGTSQSENQGGEENNDEVKYVMTFKENTNSNPGGSAKWTVNYKVFEFGEKYLTSCYYVYKFESSEDAQAYVTYQKEEMGRSEEMKIDGTTVYVYDDSYDGISLSAVKGMFDESEYTLTEK